MRSLASLALIALTGLAGCIQAPPSVIWRWDAQNGSSFSDSAPSGLQKLAQESPKIQQTYFDSQNRVGRWQNRIGAYEIEGSLLQVEKSKTGEILSASGPVPPPTESTWAQQFQKLELIQERIFRSWASGLGRRFSASEIHRELILAHLPTYWTPALKITAADEENYQIKHFYFNENGLLVLSKTTDMSGVDGTATVFTSAPNTSTLAEKVFNNLIGDGTLTGLFVRAFSAAPPYISERTNQFNYNPDRPEFDSVQAYFFADSQSRWFQEVLGLKLNQRLEIKLHVGAPQKSNAMFYYGNQVRLGDGDDTLYRGIPRDPSIVKHEVSHAFVEALSGMAFEGDAGVYSEAFADLFEALAEGKAELGAYAYVPGPYKRTLSATQFRQFDATKGKYENSMVVSTFFWALSGQIGVNSTAKLAAEFLVRMGPAAQLKLFVPVLLSAAPTTLNSTETLKLRELLTARGWILE